MRKNKKAQKSKNTGLLKIAKGWFVIKRYYFIIEGIAITVEDVSFKSAKTQTENIIQELKDFSEKI